MLNFHSLYIKIPCISGPPYKFDIDEIYIIFEIDNLDKYVLKVDIKNLFSVNPIKSIKVEQSNYKGLS